MPGKPHVRSRLACLLALGLASVPWATPARAGDEPEHEEPPQEAAPAPASLLALSIPYAVSILDKDTLRLFEIVNLKSVDRLASSLLTVSGPSEASATVLRVRGVGTVAPNPGLSPSVDVRIDGVYRGRAGTALGEFGTIDRIDVHRGPEAGLHGRSATAGVVDVLTPAPDFSAIGRWNIIGGNWGSWRLGGEVTSPVKADKAAMRFDGWWERRDGQVTDIVSGDGINDRSRYLLRGQFLWLPDPQVSLRLIGDYARRRELCCAAVYLPFPDAAAGVVDLMKGEGALLVDDPARRETSITPGRGFQSAVEDWGLSAELRWAVGPGTLTALTAWRSWHADETQDTDGNNLDLLARQGRMTATGTFSQDVRFEGRSGRLDWLVGGFFARESLDYRDDLAFGQDYTAYADSLVRLAQPAFPGFAQVAAGLGLAGETLDGRGIVEDDWQQRQRQFSLYTHNILALSDRLALTLGAGYSDVHTRLDASLAGNNALCGAIAAEPSLAALVPLACAIPGFSSGLAADRRDHGLTGTAVLAWKPAPGVLLHAGYTTGWKPGAFMLDRLALDPLALDAGALTLAPEESESVEFGARVGRGGQSLHLTVFSSRFRKFQHAAFNGERMIASTIAGCRDALEAGGCDPDLLGPALRSFGLEVESSVAPTRTLRLDLGLTFADTRFADRLVGEAGVPLSPLLSGLAGKRLPAAPEFVHTGRLLWQPPVRKTPLVALVALDWRYSSGFGADPGLAPLAAIADSLILNGRAGVTGPDGRWSVEVWASNITQALVLPVAQVAPLQGTAASGPFLAWPESPRSVGFALRTRF
ncbi:TonB-dependent receptor [Thermaurantiacus sp.]